MSSKKRVSTIMIVMLVMILSVGSTFVYAVSDTGVLSGKCGDSMTWEYNKETRTLSFKGKGKMYHYFTAETPWNNYLKQTKTIVIGEGITRICTDAIAKYSKDKLSVKIYSDMENFDVASLSRVDEITLYGGAKTLARAIDRSGVGPTIKVSKGNKKVVKTNGMIISKDKKILYYFCGEKKRIKIPNTIKTIKNDAFSSSFVQKVELGKNVRKICSRAFYDCESLKSVKFNKKLKSIGTQAFQGTKKLKKICLKSNVNMGIQAFSHRTYITSTKGFKHIQPVIGTAIYDYGPIKMKWSKIQSAEGYYIEVSQSGVKKTIKTTKTKMTYSNKKIKYKNNVYYEYCLENTNEIKKNTIFVRIRPYKTVKGKKVLGKWSKKQIVEFIPEE